MAGHDLHDDPNLKGLARYFNGTTIRGRANVAKATYALIAAYVVYRKFIKSNSAPKQSSSLGMSGDSVDESQLKGMAKYFNSQTNRGRANVAKATYAFFGGLILYYSLKPSKK